MKKMLFLTFLILIFSGCGKMQSQKRGGSGSTNLLSVSRAKVVAVVSRHQLLPNFKRCLSNLPSSAISSGTRTALEETKLSLAPDGKAEQISAPMFMAMTRVISEICQDLIDYENTQTNRKYFSGFDLDNANTANSSPNNKSAIESTARTLSSSCWGRVASHQEIEKIYKSLTETPLSDNLNRSTALFICTGMLSTTSAIKF